MIQFDTHTFPAGGGWVFTQPQVPGWKNPMAMVGFDASVKAIRQMRLQNRALAIKHNWPMDYESIADELIIFTKRRLNIPDDPVSFFPPGRNLSPQRGADVAAGTNWFRKIVRTGTGVTTLLDWRAKGANPVDPALAEKRATQCVNCPMHNSGDIVSIFIKPVADLIRRMIEERNKLNLKTSQDDKLSVCDACGCPMKLKVHVPIQFIRDNIKPTEFDQLVPECWIRHEK